MSPLWTVELVLVLTLIGMLATRRVILAWMTYFMLRRDPKFQDPRARRWLWRQTLHAANGKPGFAPLEPDTEEKSMAESPR